MEKVYHLFKLVFLGIFAAPCFICVVGVTIRPMTKTSGVRLRNKFPCNYCHKYVDEYARHVTVHHAKRTAVKAILKKPKKTRRKEFNELRKDAIRIHNQEVLTTGDGELIVARRSKVSVDSDEYLPCPKCHVLGRPKNMWRHHKSCNHSVSKPTSASQSKTSVVKRARALKEMGLSCGVVDERFKVDVLAGLRCDEVSRVIKRDELILLFGKQLYKKVGPYRAEEIRLRMRLLARFILTINDGRQHYINLMDCIDSKHFDAVLTATETLSGAHNDESGRQILDHPSNGKNLGHSLVKCADIKKRESVIRRNKKMKQQVERFLTLHKSEWNDCISSKALTALKLKRQKGPEKLPDSDDLVKLKDHIDTQIQSEINQLRSQYSYTSYRNLLEYTMASIILFNKRRGGETSKLLVQSYVDRANWKLNSNKEIIDSLTLVEKQLVKR